MASRKETERYKQKIKDIAGRSTIIPGIHNYCDRWCERCAFVSRCTVGISEFEIDGPDMDIKNKEFWEHMSMVFQATWEMIAEGAQEMGIDLDESNFEYVKPVHHKTEAEKLAEKYGLRLIKWLEKNEALFKQKAETFLLINENQLVTFQDAIDVIRWYSLFIAVKIHRAHLTPYDFDDKETDRYDKNGSAKIALIGINRSLEAFSFLYNHLHELEDEILGYLADLSHIQKLMLKTFPKAMEFKRPGFDD
jgi:drug/metabolite transporter superfamily protein YnfA